MLTTEQLVASPWFDAEWYLHQYPDVALSGLSAEVHYLRVGEVLGRWPGPYFDPLWYLATYADITKAGVSPLGHFIAYGEREGRRPVWVEAPELEGELWCHYAGGYEPILARLESVLHGDNKREASFAAWALARWWAWRGAWTRVAEVLAGRDHMHVQRLPRHVAPWLLEVDALTRLGRCNEAEECLTQLEHCAPDYSDTLLARANLLAAKARSEVGADSMQIAPDDAQRLALINTLWRSQGLAEVGLADATAPLSIDNLSAIGNLSAATVYPPRAPAAASHVPFTAYGTAEASPQGSPAVSVIMPVFNAGERLATALESLLGQTLVYDARGQVSGQVEILVVDDASTDHSLEVAKRFARRCGAVRVLSQPENRGAYAARNRGLAEACGELITVHDSDDWSHPDKLALQLRAMHDNPQWMACSSHWVRCSSELIFGHWRLELGWTYRNASSLMFRRDVFKALGYWDQVRADADTEYYHRIGAVYGDAALGEVLPGVPLALGRHVGDSLSQAAPTHLVTRFAGARHDYQQAAQAWHRGAEGRPEYLFLPREPAHRPFLAPPILLP